MTLAVARAMLLTLWRDRMALAMTFALPPLIFVVFATAFSSSNGAGLHLAVATFDAVRTPASAGLVQGLGEDLAARLQPAGSAREVRDRVRRGTADAGIVVAQDPAGPGRPAVTVVVDPAKAVAGPVVVGAVQRRLAGALAAGQPALRGAETPAGEAVEPDPVSVENAVPASSRAIMAAYDAGGVAMLFLLFSAMQGAVTLIEERTSGTLDRVLAGPAGLWPVIAGKFLFLVGQGTAQCAVVFALAWVAYGVEVPGRIVPWLGTTVLAAAAAGALALALSAACRTRQQAQASSTALILLMSAVGGSMAPRFTMPSWLQQVGWFTPNAWVIEAYQDTLWRGEPVAALVDTWAALALLAGAGLVLAVLGAGRMTR